MTRLFSIVLAAVSIYVCLAGDTSTDTCGSNEVSDDCAVDCPSDYCPKSKCTDQSSCPKPANEDDCVPGCKCGFNYRRADNKTCIPVEDCPPFECDGDNEEYNACPPLCSDDCSGATEDGECHFVGKLLFRKPCNPTCRCKKYYWRKNGTCVPYKQCKKCPGKNTEYSDCKNPYPPRLCRSLDCNDPVPCEPGCACKSGYIKIGINDTDCVKRCQCPEMANSPDCDSQD